MLKQLRSIQVQKGDFEKLQCKKEHRGISKSHWGPIDFHSSRFLPEIFFPKLHFLCSMLLLHLLPSFNHLRTLSSIRFSQLLGERHKYRVVHSIELSLNLSNRRQKYRSTYPSANMVFTISHLPDEVLSMILKHTMKSNTPMDLECFISKIQRDHSFTLTSSSPAGAFCYQPLCQYLNKVAGFSHIHLLDCDRFPPSQAAHAQDWIIANSVSHRFRSWAKEAFFSEKILLIEPDRLRRLQNGTFGSLSLANAKLMIRHAQRIVAPLSGCGSASALISIPRYQVFERLRILTLWPGGRLIISTSDPASGDLREEVHVEALTQLLVNIGLNVDTIQLKVMRHDHEGRFSSQMGALEAECFPYLRWLGEQKAKSRGEWRTTVIWG